MAGAQLRDGFFFRHRNLSVSRVHYLGRLMKRLAASLALILLSACASKTADTAAAPVAAAASKGGTYSLSSNDFTATPRGCRLGEGEHPQAWSFDMQDPESGRWSATEHYGDKSNPYTCETAGDGFSCVSEAGFDYNTTGVDADVKLDIRYDGSWSDGGALAGRYELAFTCQGAQCGEVAGQWGVREFPCANEGSFEGSR